jgi:hypothetical protein
MDALNLAYPTVSEARKTELKAIRAQLTP